MLLFFFWPIRISVWGSRLHLFSRVCNLVHEGGMILSPEARLARTKASDVAFTVSTYFCSSSSRCALRTSLGRLVYVKCRMSRAGDAHRMPARSMSRLSHGLPPCHRGGCYPYHFVISFRRLLSKPKLLRFSLPCRSPGGRGKTQ